MIVPILIIVSYFAFSLWVYFYLDRPIIKARAELSEAVMRLAKSNYELTETVSRMKKEMEK